MATETTTTQDPAATATPPPATEPEVVPREEFVNVKNDMHKYKEEATKLADRLKTVEMDKLKAAQDWQKIAEQKEREAADLESKYKGLQERIVVDKKMSVIKEAAIKVGMPLENLKDLDLLPFDDVQVEYTTTGRVNVLGAETAVARLKTLRPNWFLSKSLHINSNSPTTVNTDPGVVTYEDLKKAEADAKKTGRYEKYKDLLKKYGSQKS